MRRTYFISTHLISFLGPHEFSSIPFPVKALKLLLHDVQSGGESATITAQGDTFDVESDDGVTSYLPSFISYQTDRFSHPFQDEDWAEEGNVKPNDEFEFLSELIGPKGMAFDNDDVLEEEDDEDLQKDPVSTMDMQVRRHFFSHLP